MEHSCRHCKKNHAYMDCPETLRIARILGLEIEIDRKRKRDPQPKIWDFLEGKKTTSKALSENNGNTDPNAIKMLPRIPLRQEGPKEVRSVSTQTRWVTTDNGTQTEISTTDVINLNHMDIKDLSLLKRPRKELLIIADDPRKNGKEHNYIVGLKNTSRLKSIKTVGDAMRFKLKIFMNRTKGTKNPADLSEEAVFVFLHEFAKDRGKGNRSTSIATGTVDKYCVLLRKIFKKDFGIDILETLPLFNSYRSNWKKNVVEEHNYKIVQAPAFDEEEQETFLNEIENQIRKTEGDISSLNKQKRIYYLKLMKTVLTMVFYTGNRLGEFLNTRLYQLVFYESWEAGYSETAVSISLRGGKTDRENNKSGNISIYEDKTATFCPVKTLIGWLDDNEWKVEQDGSFKVPTKIRLFPDFRDREKSVVTSHLVKKINDMETHAGWEPRFKANTPRSSVAATAVLAKNNHGAQRITQTMLNSNFRWSTNSEMPGRYPRDKIPLAKENFAFQMREIKKQKRKEVKTKRGRKPKKVNPWPEEPDNPPRKGGGGGEKKERRKKKAKKLLK